MNSKFGKIIYFRIFFDVFLTPHDIRKNVFFWYCIGGLYSLGSVLFP